MGICNSVYTRKIQNINKRYQEENCDEQYIRKKVQTETIQTGSSVIFEVEDTVDESNETAVKQLNNITWFESWKPQAPKSVTKTFPDLVKYLTMNLINSPHREMLTVRAIIAWYLKVQDMTNGIGNQETPKGLLSLLGQMKTTYSTFFTVLCRKARIKTVQINGISKFGHYLPGDRDTSSLENKWNAVYIKGEWKLIHTYRACVSLSESSAWTWIKLPSANNEVMKHWKTSVEVIQSALKEYYIMTSPREFLYTCYPYKKKWQMLENPVSREEFLDMPYLLPTFFGLGLSLKSKQSCLLKSVNGSVTIEIECSLKNAKTLNMWYELIFTEKDTKATSGSSLVEINDVYFTFDNLQKYVTMIRNGEHWRFIVHLPVEGSYRLLLYGGPSGQHLLRICEFRLDCEQPNWGCVPLPFNPGIVGFGPGSFSEEAGLYIPSNRNGLIFTGRNCGVNIVFQMDEEALNDTGIKAELIHIKSGSRSIVLCDVEETTKMLRLTTTIPEDGDYILTIATVNENNLNADILDENDFKNICNYYITESVDSNFEDVLKTEIDSLERFKVKMESMGNFTQLPPHVNESLSEVTNITKPHYKIQEILRATLLLLGEPEDTI
ncbi:hypothetical protein KUTeg_018073 [Tegillarca granosa]|uniref:KY-like immunoglobulin-like domain-containing protein n=1 Tax=Tegillarca granosa TaxID=220873 RepID=A0ABQ9EH07_TEGGR|nr:hypothetical protein KUTeg_018073 [Tegillarca granosa]